MSPPFRAVVACTLASGVALAIAACADSGSAGAPYDETGCSAFVVPAGFGLRWENANHRIALWEARVAPSGAGACETTGLAAAYIGGDWTTGATAADVPTFSASAVPVVAEPTRAAAARQSVTLEIAPGGEAETEIVLDRAALGLRGYPNVVALVEGVRFETDVPQDDAYPDDYAPGLGYTSRGIGCGAEIVELTDETVTVRIDARFALGPSDRENMNRAIRVARTRAAVDVLVVGSAEPAPTAEIGYTLRYDRQLIGVDPEHPHADVDARTATVAGVPGGPAGTVALARFRFELEAWQPCGTGQECPRGETCGAGTCSGEYGPAGFYIREYSVFASLDGYDPETGSASISVDGFASNASTAFAFQPLESRFSARAVWLQLPTGTPFEVSTAFETGAVSVPFGGP